MGTKNIDVDSAVSSIAGEAEDRINEIVEDYSAKIEDLESALSAYTEVIEDLRSQISSLNDRIKELENPDGN